jgi:hypothetical protein
MKILFGSKVRLVKTGMNLYFTPSIFGGLENMSSFWKCRNYTRQNIGAYGTEIKDTLFPALQYKINK